MNTSTDLCALSISGETLSAWRDGLAAPAESQRLAEHIRTCAACQKQLASFDSTRRALVSQRLPESQNRVWRSLRQRIETGQKGRTMKVRFPAFGGVAGVAAALLIAIFAGLLLHAHGSTPANGTPTASQRATATQAATATAISTPIVGRWTPIKLDENGCTGENVAASPVDTQTLYFCSVEQNQQVDLSVTHDGGATWGPLLPTPVTAGPHADPELAVNPTNAQDLLLAPEVGQGVNLVYRSLDGGAHWSHLTDLGDLTFEALGWAGPTALVLTQLTESAGTPLAELYASFQGGSFVRLDHNGMLGNYDLSQRQSLFITGSMQSGRPNVILLTFGQRVQPIFATTVESVDGGTTWQQLTYLNTVGQIIDSLAASQDGAALVGVVNDAPRSAVFSPDAGRQWNDAPPIPSGLDHFNQLLVVGDGTVFATGSPDSSEIADRNVYELHPGASAWIVAATLQQSSADYKLFVQQDAQGHPVAIWTAEAGRLSVFRF